MSANPEVLNRLPDVKAQKGLAANPGKTGEMFDRSHPYYEQKCSNCWINKNKSFKNALTPSGNCNNCPLANECTEKAKMEHDKLLEERYAEYMKYEADPNYKDVDYNPETGGLKATHKGHNFNGVGGKYEIHVQNAAFKAGHSVIFGDESQHAYKKRFIEGLFDNMDFEVAGKESVTENSILRGLKHCASKRTTEVAVLDFPYGGFNEETLRNAIIRYRGLKPLNDGQFLQFKKLVCVQNEEIVLEEDF